MSNIYYSKERKISFSVYRIKLSNIPILKQEKLALYQKYAILLLNEGIISKDESELIDKISIALNIKKSFIKEFIELLIDLNYIANDNDLYHLSDEYRLIVDEEDNTIMKADIGVESADYDDLYYIIDLDRICDYSYFENNNIFISKSSIETEKDISQVNSCMTNNKDEVDKIIRKNLIKKGFKPYKDLSYKIVDLTNYSFEINTLFLYEYNGEFSVSKEIKYNENLNIPLDLMTKKGIKYSYDDELPKFIEYNKKFYEKYNDNEIVIEKLSDKEKDNNAIISKLEENIKSINFKTQTITKEKKELEKTLNKNSSEIKKLNAQVEELKKELSKKSSELKQTKTQLNNIQHERNNIKEEQRKLLNTNKSIIDPIVNVVVGKFSKYIRLNSKVNIICSNIDKAVSANEYDSFDDLFNSISQVRGLYNKTFKAIFDVVFNKTEEKLASYYSPLNYQSKMEELMKRKVFGIDNITFQNIKRMHSVFNDDYHELDLSLNRIFTKEDFKSLDKKDRYKIMISIIEFFKHLNLNANDLKKINEILSEN